MTQAYVQHTAADFAQAIESELPSGPAWSRDPDGGLMQWVNGCSMIWGDVATAAQQLLFIESDPRFTVNMLEDWEANYGLPDPCVKTTLTFEERRQALLNKITVQGGCSKQFFIDLAANLGYTITITEYLPGFQFGLSNFGGYRGNFMQAGSQYYWSVNIFNSRYTRFQFGYSQFGRDSFLEIVEADDLECVINRWKPAHTIVLFNYIQSSN